MRTPLLLAALLAATPAAAKPPTPVIELRARSIDDFLKLSDYFAGLSGQPDVGKSIVALANAFTQPKTGLLGLDRTRPLGAYAITTAAGQPAFAVMIPVKDKAKFLALLTDRFKVEIADSETGSMLTVPNVPVPIFLAFHADYAYLTPLSADWVAAENLVEPKAFFATKLADNSVMGLVVHVGDVSKDFTTAAIAQAELKTADDVKKGAKPGETEGATAVRLFAARKTVSALAAILKEGQSFAADLSVDPAADTIGFAAKVVPIPGTPMAAYVKSLAEQKGHTLPMSPTDAIAGRVNFALPQAMRAEWAGVADAILADMAADGKTASDKQLNGVLAKAIRPTLEAGVFDGAVAVGGPKSGRLEGVIGLVEGKKLEDAARGLLTFIPAEDGTAKLDVAEAGAAHLHELKIAKAGEPFGDTFWFGTAPDRLAVSSRDLAGAKALAASETAPGPVAELRMSATRAEKLFNAKKGDGGKAAAAKVFGDAPVGDRDEVAARVTGGESLKFVVTMKGKAAAFFAALDKANKGE